ncbi:MAG: hypothetical protein ABJB78_05790 [Betaproteobacteria bacterium]
MTPHSEPTATQRRVGIAAALAVIVVVEAVDAARFGVVDGGAT